MQLDTESVMQILLGIAAETAAIKRVLYKANLTNAAELAQIEKTIHADFLARPDIQQGLTKAALLDLLGRSGT
jgi:hypothetical protein